MAPHSMQRPRADSGHVTDLYSSLFPENYTRPLDASFNGRGGDVAVTTSETDLTIGDLASRLSFAPNSADLYINDTDPQLQFAIGADVFIEDHD
jgi:hypothetical protein